MGTALKLASSVLLLSHRQSINESENQTENDTEKTATTTKDWMEEDSARAEAILLH